MGSYVQNLLQFFVLALWILILARVVLSYVDNGGRSQLSAFVYAATEPILAPIRRLLPPTGMLDLSPMIVLILLSLLVQALH